MARRLGAIGHAWPRRHSGFTLLEILVALGVLAVATWILISLFSASLSYAQNSRYQKLAAGVAEEQLNRLIQTPSVFDWKAAKLEEGKPVKLNLREADKAGAGPYPVQAPEVRHLTANEQAAAREIKLYNGMQWQAYATLPKKDASYIDVSVEVSWLHEKQAQSMTLTSAVPRALVEGVS